MPFFPDLSRRNLQAELMDDPHLNVVDHRRALAGLRRVNFLSGSARILWSGLRDLAHCTADRPLRVLDIASGGGEVAVALARQALRAGRELDIVGHDISPLAVELAAEAAGRSGVRARFETHDVLNDPFPEVDVAMCSLFLHHLNESDAVRLLRKMTAAARRMVLVHDLRRSKASYLLARVACRVLSRSPVVHVDGPRSVEGAFTLAEVDALCARAGLQDVGLRKRWPCRWLLTWSRPA